LLRIQIVQEVHVIVGSPARGARLAAS
jgi:hypothetical protein